MDFFRIRGEKARDSSAWSTERVFNQLDFTMEGGRGTCLMHDVNEGLGVISIEAADRAASIRTQQDHLNQTTNLVRAKRALAKTFTG